MLGYEDIAKSLDMPRGTLSRRLAKFNKEAEAGQRIAPDTVENYGHYVIHLFTMETAAKIKAAMQLPGKKRGRPRKEVMA